MNGNSMIKHIEQCDFCLQIDEIINFLEKNLKQTHNRVEIVKQLINRQMECYTEWKPLNAIIADTFGKLTED